MAQQTREEWLAANSASKLQPWVALGISRATYYRRRGETGPRETGPRETGPRETGPRETGPRETGPRETGPRETAPRETGRFRKRWGGRSSIWNAEDGRTALRLLRVGFKDLGLGAKFEDVVEHIRPRLPELIKKSSSPTFYSGCRKALDSLPPDYDRCVSLTRLWGGQRWDADREGPYKYVDDLITIAGDNADRLGERFDRWDRQYGDPGAKFKRLERFRVRIKADPLDWPLRPKPATRSETIERAIVAFMQADPKRSWSVQQFVESRVGRKLHVSPKAMTHLTKAMRDRGQLEWADVGRSLLRLKGSHSPVRKSCSTQMIEKLHAASNHEMELYALTESVGAPTVTVVKTLRSNGVVELPDLRRGTLVRLTADALAKIKSDQPIRDGRGAVLWAPADDGRLDLPRQWTKHRQL
jgi:hypothetical protein